MSHVHGSGNLPVDSSGSDLVLFPQLLGVLRQSLHKSLVSEGLAVLHQSGVGNFVSQIIDIFAFGFDSPLFGDADQFLGIFYLVIAVSGRFIQGMADLPAMVGMGCGSACGKLQVILPTMPCTSQPQIPLGAFGVIRQGPIAQIRQQTPVSPNLQ